MRLPRDGRFAPRLRRIARSLLWLGATTAMFAAEPQLLIESLGGAVTANETAAFVRFMQAAPLPKDNQHNAMVYGAGGEAVEALGTMFEITNDRALLDRMIEFTDAMLAARNDAQTGRVLWTGQRELTWPNKAATDAEAAYTATENGDVVAHIAYAALLILRDPALAHGALGDRARTYVRELDRTVDTFLLRWIVDPTTNRYRFPVSEKWAAQGSRYAGNQGKGVPWNQQMMLNGGFQRLAECHALLGDDPARVTRYDAIVRASCDWFFSQLTRYEAGERTCYKWSYLAEDPSLKYIEDTGHAGYDILIWRAYASGRYGITPAMMQPFVNTLASVIRRPDGRFASRVDGSARGDKPATDTLGANWLYLVELAPDLFPALAASQREAARTRPELAARLLWAKHRLSAASTGAH